MNYLKYELNTQKITNLKEEYKNKINDELLKLNNRNFTEKEISEIIENIHSVFDDEESIDYNEIKKNVQNTKSDLQKLITLNKWLIFILFLFIVKYIHETIRLNALFYSINNISTLCNFLNFLSKIIMIIFILCLVKSITSEITILYVMFIFSSFLLQDLSTLFIYLNKNDTNFPKDLSKKMFCRQIIIWLSLDLIILAFLIGTIVVDKGINGCLDRQITLRIIFIIIIAIQVVIPYISFFPLYFKDYNIE